MNQRGATSEQPPPRNGTGGKARARLTLGVLVAVPFTVASLALAFVTLTHTPIPVPRWVVNEIEHRANGALEGRAEISLIGGGQIVIGPDFTPRVNLRVVRVSLPTGSPVAILPSLSAMFQLRPLLQGRIELRSVEIESPAVDRKSVV